MIKILNEYLGLNNIINDSRDSSKNGFELSKIHRKMGVYLGMEILSVFPKENKHIKNAQGNIEEIAFNRDDNTAIIALMRGGLFLSLGIFEVFPKSALILINNKKEIDIYKDVLKDKNIIIADSVINTGKSVIELFDYLSLKEHEHKVIAAAQVLQRGAFELLSNVNIDIFTIRVSDNKYKGSKSSDTGNRLFNTEFLI